MLGSMMNEGSASNSTDLKRSSVQMPGSWSSIYTQCPLGAPCESILHQHTPES